MLKIWRAPREPLVGLGPRKFAHMGNSAVSNDAKNLDAQNSKLGEIVGGSQKFRPPGNSKTRTNSAIVYHGCFMEIRIMFSTDEKYLRLVPPRGRKFRVIDTPQNFEVQPAISPKRIERPLIFFHLCIKRPDIGKTAKLWELLTSRFRTIWGQKIFLKGAFPPNGGR